jgi:hypothetical protein
MRWKLLLPFPRKERRLPMPKPDVGEKGVFGPKAEPLTQALIDLAETRAALEDVRTLLEDVKRTGAESHALYAKALEENYRLTAALDAAKSKAKQDEWERKAGLMADEAARMEGERDTLTEMVKAAQALVGRLDVVHNDYRYTGVWQLAQLHNGPYSGPTYTEELAALKQALALTPSAGHVWGTGPNAQQEVSELLFMDGVRGRCEYVGNGEAVEHRLVKWGVIPFTPATLDRKREGERREPMYARFRRPDGTWTKTMLFDPTTGQILARPRQGGEINTSESLKDRAYRNVRARWGDPPRFFSEKTWRYAIEHSQAFACERLHLAWVDLWHVLTGPLEPVVAWIGRVATRLSQGE